MAKMEAMVLRAHGGPEVLAREEIERPEPGPREVLVAVRAVAMNHSPEFAPDIEPTLTTGVEALVVAAREWLS